MKLECRRAQLHGILPGLELGGDPDEHVRSCPDCRRVHQDYARILPLLRGQHRQAAAPAGWQAAVLADLHPVARPPRRPRRWFLGAGAVVVAAAALALWLRGREGYQGIKGGALIVIRRQGEQARIVESGEKVRGGDELRFIVGGPPVDDLPFLVLGSVDGRGEFSPFYPADGAGHSIVRPRPDEPLPGGIILDETPGLERMVAVLSGRPLNVEDVARVAKGAVAAGTLSFGRVGSVPVRVFWRTFEKAGGTVRAVDR